MIVHLKSLMELYILVNVAHNEFNNYICSSIFRDKLMLTRSEKVGEAEAEYREASQIKIHYSPQSKTLQVHIA